jgi:long-chain acyl-CoA synthetase
VPDKIIYTSDPSIEVTVPASTISSDLAVTIPGLFRKRVERSPDTIAYRYFDHKESLWKESTWQEMGIEVARWQAALKKESLEKGDRVAIMAKNCREWVIFDQAVLGLGLVLVPLYTQDRADNATYILRDCHAKLLIIGNSEQWSTLVKNPHCFDTVNRVVSIEDIGAANEAKLISLQNWLAERADAEKNSSLIRDESDADELATIVYTSGTTGNAKGVMLSHRNILCNAYSGLRSIHVTDKDTFLSFLPLSHTLERTGGYYLPMMSGATVAFARSIPGLAEDLLRIRPTRLVTVPRIFERIYVKIKEELDNKPKLIWLLFKLTVDVGWRRFEYAQGRAKYSLSMLLWPLLYLLVAKKIQHRFGGNLIGAICGGAPVAPSISRIFIALGIPILQGYGLTESSPVISANRVKHNIPASIGLVFPDVEVRICRSPYRRE